jgi:hypothetical protein
MKTKVGAAAIAIIMFTALAGAPSALARAPAEGSDKYGTPAGNMPYDTDIRLSANTRGVSVWRRETVRFVTAEGREFRWRFDTFSQFEVFPLADIAPEGVAVPAGAMVHVIGDMPVGGRGGK